MKISLTWLKNYIDISNISLKDLIHSLTMAGLEVESVEEVGKNLADFIVGEVIEKKQHPDADKLSVCIVNTGKEHVQVVCGAPNVRQGQKIVFAPIGSLIPGFNEKLKKAKIRGIESYGMICSDKELELGTDHSGIKILGDDATVGLSIINYLNIKDEVLEIGITPNRPDALSHIGIARDISAIFNKSICLPKVTIKESTLKIDDILSIEVLDQKNCPRYAARVVKNVKVKESPSWLKNYLINVGLRPVNNVVDVSNFVMLEMGQPLHTFDAAAITENKIIVRPSKENEEFITLDGKSRLLPKDTLLICDSARIIAIAGVMGGQNSEISNKTKDVVIESAYFNPGSIRKTAKHLQLSTDSSYRFERGVDFNNTVIAANRAAQLIAELCDGEIVSNFIDVYNTKIEPTSTIVRFKRINDILGTNIAGNDVKNILTKLGFQIENSTDSELKCIIPSFRPDCSREIDVIEEVARIYGYDNISTQSKINFTPSISEMNVQSEEKVWDTLSGFGLSEVINNSLVNDKISCFNGLTGVKVLNPISSELSHLRPSLIPGILQNLLTNKNKFETNLSLFEIGNVFKSLSDSVNDFRDFTESRNFAVCISGLETEKLWYNKESKHTIYHIKGIIESLLEKIFIDNVNLNYYHNDKNEFFDIEIQYFSNKIYLGSIFKLMNNYLGQFDINTDVYVAEFDLNVLNGIKKKEIKFNKLSNYPKVERDISFFVENKVKFSELFDTIARFGDKTLKNINLFDQYKNPKTENQKSMSFRMVFQSEEKTLTSDDIEKKVKKIVTGLIQEFNIQLRDSAI